MDGSGLSGSASLPIEAAYPSDNRVQGARQSDWFCQRTMIGTHQVRLAGRGFAAQLGSSSDRPENCEDYTGCDAEKLPYP